MNEAIELYNNSLNINEQAICNKLANCIDAVLANANSKIWHAHPVWFLDGNPIVGYSIQNAGCRLMFWSGADFEEAELIISKSKFKDASVFYNTLNQINIEDLNRWLQKSKNIQWDYKNIVKRKGQLVKLIN
jgi:hypothetical protein